MELRGFLGSSRRSPLPLPPRPRSQLIRSAPKCHHLPALLVTPRLPSPTGATLRVGTAISTGANGACFSAAAVAAPPSRWRVVCACGAGSGAPEETRGPSPDLDGEGMNRGAPGVPGAPGVSLREPASESPNIWRQMKEIAVFAGPAAGLWVCVPLMSLIDTMVIGQGSSLELAALGGRSQHCLLRQPLLCLHVPLDCHIEHGCYFTCKKG